MYHLERFLRADPTSRLGVLISALLLLWSPRLSMRVAICLLACVSVGGVSVLTLQPPLLVPRRGRPVCMQQPPQLNELVTAISADGSISAKAAVTTPLVAEAAIFQGLGGLAAAALGRALTCSLLVAEGLKEDETFQVRFSGDGPLRGVMATANGKLESKGYVGNPAVTLPPNAMGKFDVGAGVGKGVLQVVRTKHLPGEEVPTPYASITEIRSGEIPEDINWYLAESEQKEGALAAGVYVQGESVGTDRNAQESSAARVLAAGGWYVQLLPFADDEVVERLQVNLKAMADKSPTTMIRDGMGAEDILQLLLDGLDPQILSRATPPSLQDSCACGTDRILRTLRLLPRSEVGRPRPPATPPLHTLPCARPPPHAGCAPFGPATHPPSFS